MSLVYVSVSLGTNVSLLNLNLSISRNEINHIISIISRAGGTPFSGYIGMCGPKGYGFSAFSVINRASILADFAYFGHK